MERPAVLNIKKLGDKNKFNALKKSGVQIVDFFDEQIKELAIVDNPSLLKNPAAIPTGRFKDFWIYLPWKNVLVHLLEASDYRRLRLSRNRDLILAKEQKRLEKSVIGIAGLNVGNPAAICMVLEGIGRLYKFADNDVLSVSNLNRFRAGIGELGLNKAALSARQVYEIDPFVKIKVFEKGVLPGLAEKFLLDPKIDVLVEEMDHLPLKIEIREKARANRIPVVMVTGNGENVIIDVERFDLEPSLSLMSGYLKPAIIKSIRRGGWDFGGKIKIARDFMGAKYLTKRLRISFEKVGKTLAGIPQLAESSFLRGAAVCYIARRILTGEKTPSGRYYLKLDDII